MSLPYYKRYTRDLLDGTVGMKLELKGAYGLILDLIYHHNGDLPDESGYISGQLGCTKNMWTSLKSIQNSSRKIDKNLTFMGVRVKPS